MARAKYLAWIDLETTGVDEDHDPILEVGLIITESRPPFTELAVGSWVIDPSLDSGSGSWSERMGDYVREMHTKNGLLTDIENPDLAISLEAAQVAIVEALDRLGSPHSFMLAGSGVGHFDRRFIAAQMPAVDKWLQYPCLDVGVIRRGFDFAQRPDLQAAGLTLDPGATDKPHRGLADVRDHLEEWRVYAKMFDGFPNTEEEWFSLFKRHIHNQRVSLFGRSWDTSESDSVEDAAAWLTKTVMETLVSNKEEDDE